MPALPHLQTRETESLVSSEKRPYRLSLNESLPRASREEDGQARGSNNVNNSDSLQYTQENTLVFDGTSSVWFGESVPHFQTPLPTPTPSRLLKRPLRTQENPGQPIWVEPLGIWLPNKKKWNQYETFSSHVQLLRRTSDMFLDPLPYIPRCCHERTISALRRQRQRIQTEEELKRHERNIRIIERVQQIREVWEKWSKKAQALGTEHENRLYSFRKTRDEYIDPGDIIRKKRAQRIQHERELNQERERKRKEALEKKRFKLPKIIVTQYEGDLKQVEKAENLGELYRGKTCDLVSIQLADREQSVEDTDKEATSQGNDKNILELPEMESVAHNEYYAGNLQSESKEDVSRFSEEQNGGENGEDKGEANLEHEKVDSRVELADFKNEDSKDGLEFFEQNVVENGGLSNSDIDADHLTVELENVVLEDKDAHALENAVAQSDSISEPATELISKVNAYKNESQTREEMESVASKNESKQDNVNLNVQSEVQEMSGSEKEMKLDEKQMYYLLPPAVSALVGETFPNSGLIVDADDTASLMSTFAPIPLGVSSGIIPNDAMRASSVLDRYHAPSQARLNNSKEGRNGGAWKPKISDKKQYLEIDLGAVTNVMQVATQGYPLLSGGKKVQKKEKCWVESYTLSFSTDGSQWRQCTENDVVKVFRGNKDNSSVVLNSLPQPSEARFVRFIPQSWKNSIAMRVEVYGEVLEPDISSMTPPPRSDVAQQEIILEEEEEEQVREFLCIVEDEQEFDEQATWEEGTVYSVMETASQISSQVEHCSGIIFLQKSEHLDPFKTGPTHPGLWPKRKKKNRSKAKSIVLCLPRTPTGQTVASVPQSELDLTFQGDKRPSKSKRKPKKPKEDKQEDKALKKKKKRKKMKEKITKLPPVVSSLSMIEDVEEEEDEHSSGAEQEEEEERLLSSPVLPEIPKRPESVTRIPPVPTRTFSMFPVRKETQNEESKPRRRRAQTDDSIRSEILRQQLAEDRRRKLAMMERGKREIQVRSPVLGNIDDGLDDFVTKYCIISEGQAKYYRRIFNNFDEDKDGFLFSEDLLEALESVNSHLLSDSHLNYIYRVLELCDCNLDSGADFKLFSVIAAFSQRVAVLDEFAKILISKLDFKELDYKLQRAKRLFLCYVDEERKTISLEELMLGLTAGGLSADQKEQTLQILGQTASLDFLDFLTYIPLFIHIHDHILQDPVGTVVYRSLLTA